MVDDETGDLAAEEPKRRGGLLREMSNRQLDVQETLSTVRETEDKTIVDGLAGNLGYDDDVVTAVVLVLVEMATDGEKEITPEDLVFAGEFLDHLDTQGFEIRRKARVRRRYIPRAMSMVPRNQN